MKNETQTEPQVVILGAGFAGISAIKKLEKAPVGVTLIDKNDYHTFLPLLYQVATSELGPSEVAFPARELLHGHEQLQSFIRRRSTGIDLDAKQITLDRMDANPLRLPRHRSRCSSELLRHKGRSRERVSLSTRWMMRFASRSRILERLEAADKDPSLVDDGALRFCVVGGGATGVEISGALAELLDAELAEDYPNLPTRQSGGAPLSRWGRHLLAPFKPNLQEYGEKALESATCRCTWARASSEIEPTRIHLRSGDVVKTHTLVWGAGLTANPHRARAGRRASEGPRCRRTRPQSRRPSRRSSSPATSR